MTPDAETPRRSAAAARFVPTAGMMLAAGALLVAAGWIPTRNVAGADGVRAMVLACGVSTAVALLAGWVSVRRAGAGPAALATGILAGQALRLLLTLAAIGLVVFGHAAARRPFLLWTGVSYLALLAIESVMLLRAVRAQVRPGRALEGQAC